MRLDKVSIMSYDLVEEQQWWSGQRQNANIRFHIPKITSWYSAHMQLHALLDVRFSPPLASAKPKHQVIDTLHQMTLPEYCNHPVILRFVIECRCALLVHICMSP